MLEGFGLFQDLEASLTSMFLEHAMCTSLLIQTWIRVHLEDLHLTRIQRRIHPLKSFEEQDIKHQVDNVKSQGKIMFM